MARGTRTAMMLLCALAAVLLADARHLLKTEEFSNATAVQQANINAGELQEVQQQSQLAGDDDSKEGGLELQAAIRKKARMQSTRSAEQKGLQIKKGLHYSEDSRAHIQSKAVNASTPTVVVPDFSYNDTDDQDDNEDGEGEIEYEEDIDYDSDKHTGHTEGNHKGRHAAKHSKGTHHSMGLKQRYKRSKARHYTGSDNSYDYSADSQHPQQYLPRKDYDQHQPTYNGPTNQSTYAPSNDVSSEYYAENPAAEPGLSRTRTHHIHSTTPKYEDSVSAPYYQPPQKHHHHILRKHSKAAGHEGSDKTPGYGKAYNSPPATYQEPDPYGSDTYSGDEGTYSEEDTCSAPSIQYGSSNDNTPSYANSQYGSSSDNTPSYPNNQYGSGTESIPSQPNSQYGSSNTNTHPYPNSLYGSSNDNTPSYPNNQYGSSRESNPSQPNIQDTNSPQDSTPFDADYDDESSEDSTAAGPDSGDASSDDASSGDASSDDASSGDASSHWQPWQKAKPSTPESTPSRNNKSSHKSASYDDAEETYTNPSPPAKKYTGNKSSHKSPSFDDAEDTYSTPKPPAKQYTKKSSGGKSDHLPDTIGRPPKPNTKTYKKDPADMDFWDEEETDVEDGVNIEVHTQVAASMKAVPAGVKQLPAAAARH